MLFMLHLSLQGVNETDTDPKERFVSFKVTTSNESSLFVSLEGITPESSWLGGTFLKDYKIICEINCTVDKIDRDGENKTEIFYRCCSNYALYKLIADNGIEDLWRRENPNSPKFICYDRSFAKDQCRQGLY